MIFKLGIRIGIILIIFASTIKSDDCDCSIGWRPFRQLINKNQCRPYRGTVKRSSPNDYDPNPVGIGRNKFNSELNKRVQTIQSTLSNIRSENVKKLRKRREKQKTERSAKLLKIKLPKLGKPLKLPNAIQKQQPKPEAPESGSDAVRFVKNLKELRNSSRKLAKKGLEILEKAFF